MRVPAFFGWRVSTDIIGKPGERPARSRHRDTQGMKPYDVSPCVKSGNLPDKALYHEEMVGEH